MRKATLIAGAAVAVAAVAGFAALQWAENRAAAEVERTFAALRATGATVERGPLKLDIWSRSLRIDDIRIGLAGQPAASIAIARVTADGLGLFSNDFETERLDIAGIEINPTSPGRLESGFNLNIPQVRFTNLSLPKAPSATPTATGDHLAAAGAYLQQIRVGIIVAEKLDAVMKIPVLPPPAGRSGPPRKVDVPLKYTYSNLKLDRIADGRIASVGMGKSVFEGPTGSGSVESFVIEDLDLLPFFRVGLDRRKAIDGYYAVQGKQTVGPIAIKMPDGGEIAIEGMTGTGFAIDPARLSVQVIIDMMSTITATGPNPTPAQMAAFMDTIGKLYEGIRIDDFRMLGMRTIIPSAMPGSNFSIASIALTGLAQGNLKRLQVDDVLMAPPQTRPGMASGTPQPFRLGMFALDGFDISGLIRTANSFTQPTRPGQPPASPAQLIAMLEGFQVRDVDIPDFGTGPIKIGEMKVSWSEIAPTGIPAVFRSIFKGNMPVNPRDPNMMPLTLKGIRSVALDVEIASSYSPATFELTMSPLHIKAEHFGTVSGSLVLGSVTPSVYQMLPIQFGLIAPQLTLKSLDLKLADAGLIANFYLPSVAALPSGVTPPNPIAELRQQLLDPAQPGGNLGALLDTLARFLGEPGQTFALNLTANSAVRLGELSGPNVLSAPGALARSLEKFAVDVRVTK